MSTPCSFNSDCRASFGSNFYCKLDTTHYGDGGVGSGPSYPYPNGYCTLLCNPSVATSCPSDALCLGFLAQSPPLLSEQDNLCLTSCDTSQGNTCASGYACLSLSSTTTQGVCWIDPPNNDFTTGMSCTQNSDCGPPSLNAGCIPAQGTNGATGFVGGYCSGDCTNANQSNYCGAGADCVGPFSNNHSYCYATCSNPDGGFMTVNNVPQTPGRAQCRIGYTCGGGSPNPSEGLCGADCRNLSTDPCGTGSTCMTSGPRAGYCCDVTDAGCYTLL